jgi:NADH-ubiquinone oxidoreductase chain 4
VAIFFVLDLLLFYISFEGILCPMYYLVNIYGSRNSKLNAANKLFLYTVFGSLFLLVSIITLYIECGSLDYQVL